jgi:purine-binding chemotaxis protein CheW
MTTATDLLRERARVLARPVEHARPLRDPLDVLIVDERHAIQAEHLIEVVPAEPLTPVPGAPALVLGLLNLRGRVLPVLDPLAPEQASFIVVVQAGGTTFGLAAATIEGPVRREREALERSLVSVLDPEALLADRRLEVEE